MHLHISIKPGSFSNDDSDSNENVKKAKMSKKKICKCIMLSWYTSLPSLHEKDIKCCLEDVNTSKHKTTNLGARPI